METIAAQTETVSAAADRPQLQLITKDQLCSTYLSENSGSFRELAAIRTEGWKNPQGDRHFRKQRQTADEADYESRKGFFKMMQRSGDEIQKATAALTLPANPQVLDLCMAPGGYTASALKYNPSARVSALTLPRQSGGHQVLARNGVKDPRVEVRYADITLFATELGVEEIPIDHPDLENFSSERLWPETEFDLVFCDGQVLRTHQRPSYREKHEATRLVCSQLILAIQHIKIGGTLIMLLHKADAFRTIQLLALFDKISSIELFKPTKAHATRSSFYLIAKNVQPQQAEALAAVASWKKAWKEATFPQSTNEEAENVQIDIAKEVEEVLSSFGERLIELGNPIWQIQRDALGKVKWLRPKGEETVPKSNGVSISLDDAVAELNLNG